MADTPPVPLPPFTLSCYDAGPGAVVYVIQFDDEEAPAFEQFLDRHDGVPCSADERARCLAWCEECQGRPEDVVPWWCSDCNAGDCQRVDMYDEMVIKVDTAIDKTGFTDNLFSSSDYPEHVRALFSGMYRVYGVLITKTLVILGGGGFKQSRTIRETAETEEAYQRVRQAAARIMERIESGGLRVVANTRGSSNLAAGSPFETDDEALRFE